MGVVIHQSLLAVWQCSSSEVSTAVALSTRLFRLQPQWFPINTESQKINEDFFARTTRNGANPLCAVA